MREERPGCFLDLLVTGAARARISIAVRIDQAKSRCNAVHEAVHRHFGIRHVDTEFRNQLGQPADRQASCLRPEIRDLCPGDRLEEITGLPRLPSGDPGGQFPQPRQRSPEEFTPAVHSHTLPVVERRYSVEADLIAVQNPSVEYPLCILQRPFGKRALIETSVDQNDHNSQPQPVVGVGHNGIAIPMDEGIAVVLRAGIPAQ